MSVKVRKPFCVMFRRTEGEKKMANMSKDLDKTKETLASTNESLEKAMEIIKQLQAQVETLKKSNAEKTSIENNMKLNLNNLEQKYQKQIILIIISCTEDVIYEYFKEL